MTVRADGRTEIHPDPGPSPEWSDDDAVRWLILEKATGDELRGLFEKLGVDGARIADHVSGERWMRTLDLAELAVLTLPEPSPWREGRSWFHVAVVPGAVVSLHPREVPDVDEFVREHWLARPGQPCAVEAVLQRVLQAYVEEEENEYDRVSVLVEQHAERLRRADEPADVGRVEELMTRSHHLASAFLAHERVLEGLPFLSTSALAIGDDAERLHGAARYVFKMREGVEQLLRRLDGLHQQHRMDQEQLTEARLRVLTILSAVCLPLTLIAGIYGMNFDHMPELHARNAYFYALGGMAVLSISMLLFFLRRGWFR